ncbi:GAF domain-containing sensor histidine kinase [Pelagicoccus sp. SDUM812003]|uniref:GAF domain-containing sensor histidine kinase n=1 Tax=Pelagicoccus sp. SDUM812003 TaxID=3041267 RepID=UPI00280F8A09|nr:GAF domain-containing sensor histidine kinase [Pelagicoccus sp. SDUM812003]MDQ8202436.1 GAF domain-containing sensor histidine kinase [Pelagicoccus sp. SDUM812003]
MNHPPNPEDERQRLEALERYQILDTEAEALFDSIAKLAATICDVPIALISLVDAERQWFKARIGLDAQQTHRDHAFCSYAVLDPDQVMIVPDALLDDRFRDNPLVNGEPEIRFYAGAPIVTVDKQALGTLCVIDKKPRQLEPSQIEALRHLSRQVCANLDLRIRNKRLEELNKANNKLFSVLAHDIRSPLLSILSAGDLLRDEEDPLSPAEQKELLENVNTSANSALQIAENLLQKKEFELGHFSFKPSETSISETLETALLSLTGTFKRKALRFEANVPSDASVWCDRAMLHSILLNLLSNAAKFTPRGGTITLSLRQTDAATEIAIADTGAGIKPEVLQSLFKPGAHHTSYGTDGEKGSGLGLALCRDFAAKNKGNLVLKSEYGNGTTAILTIPSRKPA